MNKLEHEEHLRKHRFAMKRAQAEWALLPLVVAKATLERKQFRSGGQFWQIVQQVAEKSPYPPAEGQIYYIRCFYCGVIEGEGHKEDCLWLHARNIFGMET